MRGEDNRRERSEKEQTGRKEEKKGSSEDNRTGKERIKTHFGCINIELILKNVQDVCFQWVYHSFSIFFSSMKPHFRRCAT